MHQADDMWFGRLILPKTRVRTLEAGHSTL